MSQDSDSIRQGSIAEFMRKRTQLVGFDFGLNKHTQYAIEFMDNALDAIESFQFKEQKKYPENFAFLLKDEALIENFDYLKGGISQEDVDKLEQAQEAKKVDDEGYNLAEDGSLILDLPPEELEPSDNTLIVDQSHTEGEKSSGGNETEGSDGAPIPEGEKPKVLDEDEEAKELRKLQKKEQELEKEVQFIVDDLKKFIQPILPLVDREPFIIIRLGEKEAPSIYKDSSKDQKDVFQYTFEIFDNGIGMSAENFEKYGKYLASSKSQKLKQTRGSQGFGASSAFSDAQNTTGLPITAVSKNNQYLFGTCSQFYTTSKNNKEYVVPPTELECPFAHGTYLRLNYLNVKYKKGYIDDYISLTALTNSHVTIIYIDPLGNQVVYPRRVPRFPPEPKYALPHPSSINIGDFQDFLRSSISRTVSGFLVDNFVRMSSGLAKTIVEEAEEDLQDVLRTMILDDENLITRSKTEADPIYYLRVEQKIYGRSKKARDKLCVYTVEGEAEKNAYFEIVNQYEAVTNNIHQNSNKISRIEKEIFKQEDKKKAKELNKEISVIEKEIADQQKQLKELRKNMTKLVKTFSSIKEIEDTKITDKMEELKYEVQISKATPRILTQKQTECLFKSFKNQKYMSPPTDTAIPIGASVLETTLIKEYKLSLSHRTDLFLDFNTDVFQLSPKEKELLPSRILAKLKDPILLTENFNYLDAKSYPSDIQNQNYEELYQLIELLSGSDEDFVAAFTRIPTSGKGLAFVVEAVIAISPKIPLTKTANQALFRFVNRTPKMRDNSDCAIWKAVQSVNWKNYKVDSFENGIPCGQLVLIVNVSGPFVHLMFKSQSKNALAEDETLMKEIKFCLETVGRKVRNYLNKKIRRETNQQRSKTIEKYIPIFLTSLTKVMSKIDKLKDIKSKQLEEKIFMALEGKLEDPNKNLPESEGNESEEVSDEESEDEGDDEDGEKPKKPKDIPPSVKKPASNVTPALEKSDSKPEIQKLAEKAPAAKPLAEKTPTPVNATKTISTAEVPIKSESISSKETTAVQTPKSNGNSVTGSKIKSIDEIMRIAASQGSGTAAKSETKTPANSQKIPDKKPLDLGQKGSEKKILDIGQKTGSGSTGPSTKQVSIVPPQKSTPSVSSQKSNPPLVTKPSQPSSSKQPVSTPVVIAKPAPSVPEVGAKPAIPSLGLGPKLVKPQSKLDLLTADSILESILPNETLTIRDIITRMKITDMQVARYLQIKLNQLVQQRKLIAVFKEGKNFYKKP